MGDKDGLDGFFTKALNPCSLLLFATIAPKLRLLLSPWRLMFKASCGFVLESPLGWSAVGTPLSPAFLSGFTYFGLTMLKISSLCLTVLLDMGQRMVANHSKPFVLCLKCLICFFFFANIGKVGDACTYAHTHMVKMSTRRLKKKMFAVRTRSSCMALLLFHIVCLPGRNCFLPWIPY